MPETRLGSKRPAAMQADFNFESWCEKAELAPDTQTLLSDNGLTSCKSLRKLTPELIKEVFGSINLGQHLLLEDAVQELNSASATPVPPFQNGGASVDVHPAASGSGNEAEASNHTPADILALLNSICRPASVDTIPAPGDARIMQDGGSSPTPGMVDLLSHLSGFIPHKPSVPLRDVRDFVSSVPTGSSDQSINGAQSENNTQWNTDNPFPMQAWLRPKTDRFTQPDPHRNRPFKPVNQKATFDPKTAKPICERFNGRNGCNLRICNYAHVCASCFAASHGDFQHRPKTQQQQPAAKND